MSVYLEYYHKTTTVANLKINRISQTVNAWSIIVRKEDNVLSPVFSRVATTVAAAAIYPKDVTDDHRDHRLLVLRPIAFLEISLLKRAIKANDKTRPTLVTIEGGFPCSLHPPLSH